MTWVEMAGIGRWLHELHRYISYTRRTGCEGPERGGRAQLRSMVRENEEDLEAGASPPVQGATVLHRLARLYGIAIQGATQRATKCYAGCYICVSGA